VIVICCVARSSVTASAGSVPRTIEFQPKELRELVATSASSIAVVTQKAPSVHGSPMPSAHSSPLSVTESE